MKYIFCLALFIAVAAAQLINSPNDIAAEGVTVRVLDTTSGKYARLLPNDKLFMDAAQDRAANFILSKSTTDENIWSLQNPITSSYVSAEEAGKKSLRATRPWTRTWERFQAANVGSGIFTLTSKANNKLVTLQTQKTLIANTPSGVRAAGTTFSFEVVNFPLDEATVSEGIMFLRQNTQSIGGSGANFILNPADSDPVTVTFKALATQPTTAYTTYGLIATSNNKYLCYAADGLITASCNDDTSANSHWHFYNGPGGAGTDDVIIIANDVDNFVSVSADGTLHVNSQATGAKSNFEVTPVTLLGSGLYKISHRNLGTYLNYVATTGSPAPANAQLKSNIQSITLTKVTGISTYFISYKASASISYYLTTNADGGVRFVSRTSAPSTDAFKWVLRGGGSKRILLLNEARRASGLQSGATPGTSNGLSVIDCTDNTFNTNTIWSIEPIVKRGIVDEMEISQ